MPRESEALRDAMMDMARVENQRARKQWGQQTWDKVEQSKINGAKGGKPRVDLPKMSQKAHVLNRMLLKGIRVTAAAEILGISHQAVGSMCRRYGLPRSPDKK